VKTNSLTDLSIELRHWLTRRQPPVLHKRLTRLQHRVNVSKGWLIGGAGLLLLWVWVWQWLLSIAVGLAVMVGVYLTQQGQLKLNWQGWQRLWNRSNRSLSLSVLAGTIALGSTYLATAVWVESEQHWMATSILLEGFGLLAIGCLLWQLLNRPVQEPETNQFHTLLTDLSHTDPLKRLIAVRQATHHVLSASEQTNLPISATQLAECFRLMLDRETEPLVCHALLESVQKLSPVRQIAGSSSTSVEIKTPIRTKVAQQFSLDD
jgi:uncharacterized membrane protein (Fun14 family)